MIIREDGEPLDPQVMAAGLQPRPGLPFGERGHLELGAGFLQRLELRPGRESTRNSARSVAVTASSAACFIGCSMKTRRR